MLYIINDVVDVKNNDLLNIYQQGLNMVFWKLIKFFVNSMQGTYILAAYTQSWLFSNHSLTMGLKQIWNKYAQQSEAPIRLREKREKRERTYLRVKLTILKGEVGNSVKH